MPAGINTQVNIGIRRVIYTLPTPQYRNFEVNGTQAYRVTVSLPVGYSYTYVTAAGVATVYNPGQTIPFDTALGYSNWQQLERDFNAGLIDPAN